MSRFLSCLVLCLLALTTARAQLVEYWIPDEGCTIFLPAYNDYVYSHRAQAPLTIVRERTTGVPLTQFSHYEWVSDTQLGLASLDYPGPDGESYVYDPPLIVLDLPLTTDKVWSSTSIRRSLFDGGQMTYDLTCRVVGPRTVDSVLGPMEVIEVNEVLHVPGHWFIDRTRYLHRQYGDVYELIDVEDCAPMPLQAVSWSEVKSLYR